MFLLVLFFLGGCNGHQFYSPSNFEKKIKEIENKQKIELKAATETVLTSKNNQIKQIEKNFELAMTALYGGRLAFSLLEKDSRAWKIANNRFGEAAAYGPAPSREGLIEQAKLLQEELDETKISNEELAKRYNESIARADEAVAAQKQKELEAVQKQKELENLKESHSSEIINLQKKAIDDQNLAMSELENKLKNEHNQAIERSKRWAAGIVGGISLACLAGAIFSPLFKDKLGLLAGILGGVAIGILFLTPLMVGMALAFIMLVVGIIVVIKFGKAEKVNNNLINAMQEIKEVEPDVYEKSVKNRLIDWNSKYKKIRGKIEKVKDMGVEKYIESKLINKEKI
jgi:hypothetical protein